MAFIFTCGTHTFQSLLEGYENITAQCQNCGNWTAKVVRRWEWFTFCFVPIIPFSLKPWHEMNCHICNFRQDIKYRPDVQQQMAQGGGPGAAAAATQIPLQQQQQWQQQSGPQLQGWNSPPPPHQGYYQPQGPVMYK